METVLSKTIVEHEVINVNFMNENIIPLETMAQKVDFCETRVARVQIAEDATMEELDKWLTARQEIVAQVNETADKLFEKLFSHIWEKKEPEDEDGEPSKGDTIEKSSIGVIDRYKMVFDFIGAVHLSEDERKNLERELAGISKSQESPETAESAETTS
jgi:hypothetical protein